MIKKICKLNKFGIFHDFLWPIASLPEFNKFNLIYGWNYSGKTTLSRVFRCFEKNDIHKDYIDATFEVELDDGTKHNQASLVNLNTIRVFNSDFVRENLKWEAIDENIEPVFLLGEKNIKLEQQLKIYKKDCEELKATRIKISADNGGNNEKIETGLTNKASQIKIALRLPLYNKNNFEPVVKDITHDSENYKLSDKQVENYLTTYQSTDKKDIIPKIDKSIPDFLSLCDQIEKILNRTATSNIIERLKDNSDLDKWVKEGKLLHADKSTCEFCENKLPRGFLDRLNEHYSKEYDNLMNEIDEMMKVLIGNKVELAPTDQSRFYQELRKNYEASSIALEEGFVILNNTFDELLEILEDKKTKPFMSVALKTPQINIGLCKKNLDIVNEIIQENNNKTNKFESERSSAKDKLINHWASEFINDIKYNETLKTIKNNESEITNISKKIDSIQQTIDKIEQHLSEAVKGADKINEYLQCYFGSNEIEMVVSKDGMSFKLERSKHRADNLSEGEKTAIAFSYFMTTLVDKKTALADTIVFIDDPISSLDSNHLFHTYALIKTNLSESKQLFISTHNYEFFNLIKDWRKKDGKYPMTSLYLIEKETIKNTDQFRANLCELPKPLSKFRSEYVYLFSLIHQFNDNPSNDHNCLYLLPNLIRRYLEAYIGFRTLDSLKKNLSILIDDKTSEEKVFKLINQYSHNKSSNRLLHFPDFGECKSVVKIVLNAVESKDDTHYKALIDACRLDN